MKNLLIKELRLTVHPLTWIFLAFAVMTLIPGYPILVGSFFICFGIFQTFQSGRESNDVLYTALLPLAKGDAVRARYTTVTFFQMLAFLLMALLTALRMTTLRDSPVYTGNFMMNANLVYLGYVLVIFALFDLFFVGPFYRTAYKFGKPFILFLIVSFLFVSLGETMHHLPGLAFLNTCENLPVQLCILLVCLAFYILSAVLSCKRACRSFELLDL